jgi:hypothetical protein
MYENLTSADLRNAIERSVKACKEGQAQLADLERVVEQLKADNPRRSIYLEAIAKMKTLVDNFRKKMRGYESELRRLERKESKRRAA